MLLEQRSAIVPNASTGVPVRAVFNKAFKGLAAIINDNPISHCSLMRVIALNEEGPRDSVQYLAGGELKLAASKSICSDESEFLDYPVSQGECLLQIYSISTDIIKGN